MNTHYFDQFGNYEGLLNYIATFNTKDFVERIDFVPKFQKHPSYSCVQEEYYLDQKDLLINRAKIIYHFLRLKTFYTRKNNRYYLHLVSEQELHPIQSQWLFGHPKEEITFVHY